MSSLAELVADLPARVHRGVATTKEAREQIVDEPYSDEAYEQWLADLRAEEARRGSILPSERPQRPLDPTKLREGALADLLIEKNRTPWGGNTIIGAAPPTHLGLKATLRSYLDAKEPCDRYDSLIRHAATALALAEAIAAGRA